MSVMIWDSTSQTFKEANIPMIYDTEYQVWKETTGLVWDETNKAYKEAWSLSKIPNISIPFTSANDISGFYYYKSTDGTSPTSGEYISYNDNGAYVHLSSVDKNRETYYKKDLNIILPVNGEYTIEFDLFLNNKTSSALLGKVGFGLVKTDSDGLSYVFLCYIADSWSSSSAVSIGVYLLGSTIYSVYDSSSAPNKAHFKFVFNNGNVDAYINETYIDTKSFSSNIEVSYMDISGYKYMNYGQAYGYVKNFSIK